LSQAALVPLFLFPESTSLSSFLVGDLVSLVEFLSFYLFPASFLVEFSLFSSHFLPLHEVTILTQQFADNLLFFLFFLEFSIPLLVRDHTAICIYVQSALRRV